MRRAQSILEYTIIIAVVVAALMAMGTYVRRSIQANLKMIEEQINAEPLRERRNIPRRVRIRIDPSIMGALMFDDENDEDRDKLRR